MILSDVKFFGAIEVYMLWDESGDDLIVKQGRILVKNSSGDSKFIANTNGNVTINDLRSLGGIKLETDSSIIKFGANDEITLTHVHNSGLTLTNTITSDNTPVVFQLKSEQTLTTADRSNWIIRVCRG